MTAHSTTINVPVDEQEALWYLGGQRIITALKEILKGAFRLTELVTPAGTASAALKHKRDDALYVLAGEATVACGGQDFPVCAGTFLFLPCHVPHQMQVGTDGLSYLTWMTPAGFAQDVLKMGTPNRALLLAPAHAPDSAKVQRLADLLRANIVWRETGEARIR